MTMNDRVHMDLIGPLAAVDGTHRYVLSMTDAFTRWPEATILTAKEAEDVATAFVDQWISRFGPPEQLVTDQGPEFTARVVITLTKAMGVQQLRTTPYHPQTNGLEERAHKTLAGVLAMLMEERRGENRDWTQMLQQALFVMRTTVHQHGFTPARLLYGFELPMPDALHHAPNVKRHLDANRVRMELRGDHHVQAAQGNVGRIVRLWQRVYDKTTAENDGAVAKVLPPGRLANLKPGDYVRIYKGDLLHQDERVLNPKLEAKQWSTPWRVKRIIRGVSAELTSATDPLLPSRPETGLRIKRIELPEQLRQQYEQLYERTVKEKEAARRDEPADSHGLRWDYRAPTADVDEILRISGTGSAKQVLVCWTNGERQWEPYERIRQLANDKLKAFKAKERAGKRAAKEARRQAREQKKAAAAASKKK
jgi:hypothetical protein